MRTYGKINGVWQKVETDAAGHDDYVYITTLAQNLKLVLNESPYFALDGIPAQDSIVTQIFPDFYVAQIQRKFAQFFVSLNISKRNGTTPTYDINLMTNKGVVVNQVVAV